ncbi:MAG: MATE family efflux transporter [Clostridia bacterium]|nr:MATE family efflux transporter [Clostridia bacterium]
MARTRDMTTGSPTRHLIFFTLPIIAGNAFQQLYSLLDSFVVGQVSVDALTAVASAGWLDWLVLSLAIGLAQGFGIQVAQSFGAGDYDELHRAVGQSLILSVATVVVVELLAQVFIWPILVMMDMPDLTIRMTESYLRIIFAGLPLVMGFNLFSGFLRSVGNSVTPLIAMICAALTNMVLDVLFVMGFGWGVEGAALATISGQGLSCLICLIAVLRTPVMHISRSDLRFDGKMCARLMKLGIPISFQNLIISIGGLALQKVVNGFRYAFVAGFNAANRLVGLLELAGASLGNAVGTFAGQNLGAGRIDRVKLGQRRAAQLSILLGVLVGGVIILFGKDILGLFITDSDPVKVAETLAVAYEYLTVMCIGLPMLYLLFTYRTTLQGIGDTFIPMVSGFVELVMRIACAVALPLVMGEWGIYLSEIAAWVGAAILLMWGYYRRIHLLERNPGYTK